jgi:DNA-binding Xre family transcriptional regulator
MSVRLDADQLDYVMAVRVMTARQLAALSGIGEATISRARNRHKVTPATMLKLLDALARVEVPGAADLIGAAERSPA